MVKIRKLSSIRKLSLSVCLKYDRLLFADRRLAGLYSGSDDRGGDGVAAGRGRQARVVSGPDGFGNLGGVAAPLEVLLAYGLLDAVHLVLVALPVPHGALLGLLQRRLQGLNNFF